MTRRWFDLGDGASIRPFEMGDLAAIWAIVDGERDRLGRWFAWPAFVRTIDDQLAWLARATSDDPPEEGWAILDEGTFVGGITLSIDQLNDCGEFAYWLGSAYEGRGLITRAVKTLTGHAFEDLALHRLIIQVATTNVRSRAVPERLGYREEGQAREAVKTSEGYLDLVIYAMLVHEWRAAGDHRPHP